MNKIILQTERLYISPISLEEVGTFMEYRNDPKNAKFQSWEPNYTLESASEFIIEISKIPFPTKGKWNQLAVFLTDSKIHIGDIAFKLSEDGDQADIGYTFATKYQGMGYATEAVRYFINYCFTQLNLHRIVGITDRENIKSITLLERLKFRREAHFVQNIWFKGQWGDEYQYAILKEEWKNNRKKDEN